MDYGCPGFEIHQIHNPEFEMDLTLQIKTPWILDGFGFTKEIHEIHEIHEIQEFRSCD